METQANAGGGATRKAGPTSAALTGTWRPSSANEERRTVEVTWTTGADVERADPWTGERYIERLRVDDKSIDLTRLIGGPVLDSHDRSSVKTQVGVIEDAWIVSGKGHARVRFASDADSDLVWRKVREGIAQQTSVGYGIEQVKVTRRKDAPDIHEAVRWVPREISIVTVGADAGARVRSQTSYPTASDAAAVRNHGDQTMPEETNGVTPIAAERERTQFIVETCTRHAMPELQRELLAGVPLEQARTRVLEELAKRSDATEIDSHHTPDDVMGYGQRILSGGNSRARSFADDAAEALLVRERILKDTDNPEARQLVDASFSDLAERALQMGGTDTRSIRDKQTLFKRAFITSSTLSDTLATFSTRSLMSGYEAVPRTFIDAFRESVSRNFKPNERIRVSDTPALAVVAEGANFQEVTLTDRKESFTIAKFGHILKYTLEALTNDDLGAIGREAERAGFAAAVTESNVFWSLIAGNAAMSDGDDIFDTATHGNLVAAVALSADALEDAREYFRTVATENSVKLNLAPKYLFVAPDLERTAEKLTSPPANHSTATITDVLSNAYASQLELRVESRLPAGDWMVAADFRQIDTLEYAWLEGRRGAGVEQDGDFDSMGIKFLVSDFFGAGAVDRKGLYYNDAA